MTDNDKAYDEAKLAFLAAAYVYCQGLHDHGVNVFTPEALESMMDKWKTWEIERQKYIKQTLAEAREALA